MSHPRRPGDPRADRLRARHARIFGATGPPVPVESIAEDLLGLAVGEAEMGVSGLLIPARREIWVNAGEARESPARRRFTIAHEVGHWVCQVREGRGEPIHCRPDPEGPPATDEREREANVFAAELLMPEGAVRREATRGTPAGRMESLFGVSAPAMAWRLFNLGITATPPP